MNSNLKQQLKHYTALSAGLMTSTAASATVQTGTINETFSNLFYYSSSFEYSVDLDGNGVDDFIIGEGVTLNGSCPIPLGSFYGLSPFIYGVNGEISIYSSANANGGGSCSWLYNKIGSSFSSLDYAIDHSNGEVIDSGWTFKQNSRLCNNIRLGAMSYTRKGLWSGDLQTEFVGLRFNIGANVHYGWLRLTVDNINHELTIHDYGYEDTPDLPIMAGQMFLAPPPASSSLVNYSSSSLIASFQASSAEEAVAEYRMFVVKEGTTFDLTIAESNTNFVAITPDGSATYSHTFESTAPDSDGDIFTKSNLETTFLDTDGQSINADQNYRVYILNMAKSPIASENVLSTPSEIFTVAEPTVSLEESNKQFSISFNNNQLNISIDNALIGAQLEVIDILGKKHLSINLNSTISKLDINLPNGIYIVAIRKEEYLNSEKIFISN